MQSLLCTLTTSSDTFCTAVKKNKQKKRKHSGEVGMEAGMEVGMRGSCETEERNEVEGSKEETEEERIKVCHSGRKEKSLNI